MKHHLSLLFSSLFLEKSLLFLWSELTLLLSLAHQFYLFILIMVVPLYIITLNITSLD